MLIYFGLIFVAAASTIFATCCPLEVKRYASSEEYIAGDEPFLSDKAIAIIQNRLELGDEIARNDTRDYRTYYNSRPAAHRAQEFHRIQLDLYYEMLNRCRAVARMATALLYLIGIGLLLWPSLAVFLKVLSVLYRRE